MSKRKLGICYLYVGMLPKTAVKKHVKKQLKILKEWSPKYKWLALPIREGNTYIEFVNRG